MNAPQREKPPAATAGPIELKVDQEKVHVREGNISAPSRPGWQMATMWQAGMERSQMVQLQRL